MLNMLIAIMGDTFGRVQEDAVANNYHELCRIMAENEVIINRSLLFGDLKYIFTINEEAGLDAKEESWEGNFKQIKKNIGYMLDSHKYRINQFSKPTPLNRNS
jgi:hypothetical protein